MTTNIGPGSRPRKYLRRHSRGTGWCWTSGHSASICPPPCCVWVHVWVRVYVCLCRVCLCVSLCFDEAAGLSRELGAGPLMLPADAGVGAGGDAKCWLMGTHSQVLEGQGRRGLQHWRLGHRWLEDENGRCSQANPSSQLPFCSSRVALPRATLGSSGSPHAAAAAAAAAADLRAVGQSNVIRRVTGCMRGERLHAGKSCGSATQSFRSEPHVSDGLWPLWRCSHASIASLPSQTNSRGSRRRSS